MLAVGAASSVWLYDILWEEHLAQEGARRLRQEEAAEEPRRVADV